MSKIINALITIDTDKVKGLSASPSQKSESPTSLSLDQKCAFMVVSGANAVTDQGSWSLTFSAGSGDVLRAFAASGSNNFEDVVLLYGFTLISGDMVTDTFQYKLAKKTTIVGGKSNPLPGSLEDSNFSFFQANVNTNKGQATFNVNFALYTRDSTNKPVLKGYYCWDPTIKIVG